MYKAGFVNILGMPNAGKSTLVNALIGEKLNIVTHKPQTTRHRIFSIYNEEKLQIVFSDTPGFVGEESYAMHKKMNAFVRQSLEDADLILFVVDLTSPLEEIEPFYSLLKKSESPIYLVLNKIDSVDDDLVVETYKSGIIDILNPKAIFSVSAKQQTNIDHLFESIKEDIPQNPPYFPDDQLSDRSMRFFVSEMIREKIFLNYKKEIPYSTEVQVTDYKDSPEICRIRALLFVERKSQKNIIIGNKGSAIKQVGIEARKEVEAFIDKKVYLELHVKVREKWRNNENLLDNLGYKS